jgi:hypothetical protein
MLLCSKKPNIEFGAQDEQSLCEESGGIKMDGDEVMVSK